MSTQDFAAASRFMPATGKTPPTGVFAVRKRHQTDADAWWETVTNYIPAPWHPARSIAFVRRKKAKSVGRGHSGPLTLGAACNPHPA